MKVNMEYTTLSKEIDIDGEDMEIVSSVLKKTIHGGFVSKGSIETPEEEFCEKANWIKLAEKFKCSNCGNWHTKDFETAGRCPRTMYPANEVETTRGYRREGTSPLQLPTDGEKNVVVVEHTSYIVPKELPANTVVFALNIDEKQDGSNNVVSYRPIEEIVEFFE